MENYYYQSKLEENPDYNKIKYQRLKELHPDHNKIKYQRTLEKYPDYCKIKYQRAVELHGREYFSKKEKERMAKMTLKQKCKRARKVIINSSKHYEKHKEEIKHKALQKYHKEYKNPEYRKKILATAKRTRLRIKIDKLNLKEGLKG